MSEELNTQLLRAVLDQYATPDPKIVGTIPRNGINLAYVSHADITKILIEVDPAWSWQPVEWVNGRPAINVENGTATMWGTLTLLGKSMLGVGSVRADKQDLDKELVGDFLRNAAMRFGIALSLWSKQDWSDNTTITSLPAVQAKRAEEAKPYVQNHPAKGVPSPKVVRDFAARQRTNTTGNCGDRCTVQCDTSSEHHTNQQACCLIWWQGKREAEGFDQQTCQRKGGW
jgi:hypothetical protein